MRDAGRDGVEGYETDSTPVINRSMRRVMTLLILGHMELVYRSARMHASRNERGMANVVSLVPAER